MEHMLEKWFQYSYWMSDYHKPSLFVQYLQNTISCTKTSLYYTCATAINKHCENSRQLYLYFAFSPEKIHMTWSFSIRLYKFLAK